MPPQASHWKAILWQRCPRCLQGQVFTGWFAMNEHCPVCGIRFEREQGYFFGAMYVSYPLSFGLLGGLTLLFSHVFPDWEPWQWLLLAYVPFLLFVPAIFRYSRILWMHWDRWADPNMQRERKAP